jgi:hypothetical protein
MQATEGNNPERLQSAVMKDYGGRWWYTASKAFSTKGSLVEYPIEKFITAENPLP